MPHEENDANGLDGEEEIIPEHNDKKIIVNELLCYVSYYLKHGSAAPENIKHVVLSFYDEGDILMAKRVCWQCTKAGVLKKYEKRKKNVTKK